MQALVMMLFNTATKNYHPILYFEKPMPGPYDSEENRKIVRFKSKGHRTVGFADRAEAVASIEKEITPKMPELNYTLRIELEGDLEWDGVDMPIDTQIRNRQID